MAAHIAMLALIGYQGWLFVKLFYLDDGAGNHYVTPKSAPPPINKVKSQTSINELVDAHIFGIQGMERPNIEEKPKPAVPSTKPYRIAGLAYGGSDNQSSVVLEIKPGDMVFLRPGDTIEPGVALEAVDKDEILIQSNGRRERIAYVKVRQPVLIKVKESKTTDRSQRHDDWEWLKMWDQLSVEQILKELGIVSKLDKYTITEESPLLANWNISPGDVLLSINGHALADGESIKSILRPLILGETTLVIENTKRRNLIRWKISD